MSDIVLLGNINGVGERTVKNFIVKQDDWNFVKGSDYVGIFKKRKISAPVDKIKNDSDFDLS